MSKVAIPTVCRRMMLSEPGPVTNFKMASDAVVKAPVGREVLVKVHACALAFRDVLDRQGAFKFINRPTVLGHEFAGVVVARGPDAVDHNVGDKVLSMHWDQTQAWPSPLNKAGAVDTMFGLTCDGGYGEYVTAPYGSFGKAPGHMTAVEAACVMSTFGTVWNGAFVRGQLQSGSRVLVTGASGGVGSAAVQLARAHGCSVTAVTTSEAKAEFLKERVKADDVVIAKADGSFKAAPHDMTIECVGGPTFASSLRATAPGGKMVLVGNVTNAKVDLPLGLCILNSISIIGSDSIRREDLSGPLADFMKEHDLRPSVHAEMPLAMAGVAHTMLERRAVCGRIVLNVAGQNW